MIKSFTVRATKESLVASLVNDLDRKLAELQNNGWKIINVTSMPVKEWDYPKYFDSTAFVIIAERDDFR